MCQGQEDLTQTVHQHFWQVSKLFNVGVVLSDFLDAQVLKRLCADTNESVKAVAFDLSSLSSCTALGSGLSIVFLFISGQLLAAGSTNKASIRTIPGVRRYGEALTTDLAVLELARLRLGFLGHVHAECILVIVVVIIIRAMAFLGLLARLALGF